MLNTCKHLDDQSLTRLYPWFFNVKSILITCGIMHVWSSHSYPSIDWLKIFIKHNLKDLFMNEWLSSLDNCIYSAFYKLIKRNLSFESYLVNTPHAFLKFVIRIRTRNHRLPIEVGNWNRTPIDLRTCTACNKIAGEFHYLLEYQLFNAD